MIDLEIFTLTLETDRAVKGNAQQLRGYFATKFNEYILLHHHNADKFVYRYPLVQYKILQSIPTIIGINEGSHLLKEIYHLSPSIRLGEDEYRIVREGIDVRRLPFGLDTTFRTYEFITPWIALNQENYQAFYRAKSAVERQDLLRRILTGNILSMSKSLGYQVPGQIRSEVDIRPAKQRLKDVNVMAFSGKFYCNFQIPDYLGIGKSVSRGFGALKQKTTMDESG